MEYTGGLHEAGEVCMCACVHMCVHMCVSGNFVVYYYNNSIHDYPRFTTE